MNCIHICSDANRDLAGTKLVEVGYVLTKDGSKVLFSGMLRDMLSCIDEANCRNIGRNKGRNAYVNQVQSQITNFMAEGSNIRSSSIERGKRVGDGAKNNLRDIS